MRNKLSRSVAGVVILTLALSSGSAFSQVAYDGPGYIGTDRSQSTRPYDEVSSELNAAKRRADGRYGGNSSRYAKEAYDAMERAMAYRDAGDMKKACRYATLAVGLLNRAGFDRSRTIVSAYADIQSEFCEAANAA